MQPMCRSATDMNYSTLLLEINDGIATITLNRPERLNCFNRTMVLEFRDLWGQASRLIRTYA